MQLFMVDSTRSGTHSAFKLFKTKLISRVNVEYPFVIFSTHSVTLLKSYLYVLFRI